MWTFESFLFELDRASATYRKTMGVLSGESAKAEHQITKMATELAHMGASADDIARAQTELSSNLTGIIGLENEIVSKAVQWNKQFNISYDTSAKFLKTLAGVSGTTIKAQTAMIGFAKEMAMAVIEFIHCLKYRSRRVAKVWDFVTLGAWFVTLLLMFFAINPATMIICVVAGIITCVVNSLIGTKILKLYETIKYTRTLMNISRFIDFNYEIMRALVLLAGIVIIEFVVLNLK